MNTLKTTKRYNIIQVLVIAFIWLLMFAIPLLFGNFPEDNDWIPVLEIWKGYGYLFLLFLFNHFVLLPHFFFKQHRLAYFGVAALMVVVFFVIIYFSYRGQLPERYDNSEVVFEQQHMLPNGQDDFNHRPLHPNFQKDRSQSNGDFQSEEDLRNDLKSRLRPELDERQVSPFEHPEMHPIGPRGKPEPAIPPYANLLILAVLLLGFDTALSISMKWVRDEQKRVELEKENTENKLIFLRQQVSPHFFMNTLNNIHALIDINQEQAKESVIKLSKLMNYLIYDTQGGKVMLKDELSFIESYIELMQLRFSNKIKLDVLIPSDIPQVEISPLLFISFIENAFKYGISYQAPSFVKIAFVFDEKSIEFSIDNSLHPKREKREKSGFGIENTRKRLELLYNSVYNLNIIESAEQFSVTLNLPL